MVKIEVPAQEKIMTVKEAYTLMCSAPTTYPQHRFKFTDYQEKLAFNKLCKKGDIVTLIGKLKEGNVATLEWTTYWDNDEGYIHEWSLKDKDGREIDSDGYSRYKKEDKLLFTESDLWELQEYAFPDTYGEYLLTVSAGVVSMLAEVEMPVPELQYTYFPEPKEESIT